MADKETRRERLRTLIDDHFMGVAARLATALDMKPPQLHRWLSGRQGISEESARGIEQKLDLTPGWLDRPSDDVGLSPEAAEFAERVRHELAERDVPEHMMETILTIISSSPKKKKPE